MASTTRVLRSHTKKNAPSPIVVPVQSPGKVKKEVKKASNILALAEALQRKNAEIAVLRRSITVHESRMTRLMAEVAQFELEVKNVPDTRTLQEKFVVSEKSFRASNSYTLADRLKNKTQLAEDLKEHLSYVCRVCDGWLRRKLQLWRFKTFSLVNTQKKAAEKLIFDHLMAEEEKKKTEKLIFDHLMAEEAKE